MKGMAFTVMILIFSGCASMVRGAHQEVEIRATPPAEACYYKEQDKFVSAIPPFKINLLRRSPVKILCNRKEGDKILSSVIDPKEWSFVDSGWHNIYFWTDVIGGGIIGLFIDKAIGGPLVFAPFITATSWEDIRRKIIQM